jgi:hypothetical protein
VFEADAALRSHAPKTRQIEALSNKAGNGVNCLRMEFLIQLEAVSVELRLPTACWDIKPLNGYPS